MRIGFTTLALGDVYRRLARLLAADLKRWSPHSQLVVLTDRPQDFADLLNVNAVGHRQESIFRPYHDKRFTLRGNTGADVLVYLDADSRVFGPPSVVTEGGTWPITDLGAHARWQLSEKFEAEARSEREALSTRPRRAIPIWDNSARSRERLVRAAAKVVGVDLEEVVFVYEQCFCVPGHGYALDTFIETWGVLASFLERRGLTWGEGEVIGVAAAAAGWSVRQLVDTPHWFFNDVFARNRLHEGEVLDDREASLLREHDAIRSQASSATPFVRTWHRVRPLVRNPLLGPSVCFRRWNTLRGA